MKNKVFVITDERCGGTELGTLFKIIGYNIIDDPQTLKQDRDSKINNKEFVLNNIEYFFEKYDYVKICMVSYTEEEYVRILKKVVDLDINCKIIFLWRRNYLERGLSKAIAIETGVWSKKDKQTHKQTHNFKIDRIKLKNIINENKKKIMFMDSYLKSNNIRHYPLLYENIYNKDYDGSERVNVFYKILKYVDPDIENSINIKNRSLLIETLCPCKKVNDISTYKRIININELLKEFSSIDNGIIKLSNNKINLIKKHNLK
jgi:hypothetical protein